MVTNLILGVLKGILTWILGLLPHLSVPSWITGIGDALGTVSRSLSGSSSWVPWNLLMLGVGVTLLGIGIGVAIRGIRIVASFLTLGGGS